MTPEAAVERLRLAWSQVARAQRLAVDEDRDRDAILLGEVLGMLGERPAEALRGDPESGFRLEARLATWVTLPSGVRVQWLPDPDDRGRVWLEVDAPDAPRCKAVHYSGAPCTSGVAGHPPVADLEGAGEPFDHANPERGVWWTGTTGDPEDDQQGLPPAAGSTATALALALAESKGWQAAFNLAAEMIDNHTEWLQDRIKAAQNDVKLQAGRENYLSAALAQERADALGKALASVRELLSQVQDLERNAG